MIQDLTDNESIYVLEEADSEVVGDTVETFRVVQQNGALESVVGNMPRKRAPRGRSKPRKKAKAGTRKKKVSENLLGVVNPFAPVKPKIPDGSVVASLPLTHRQTKIVSVPAGKTGHIILYGGYYTGYSMAITNNESEQVVGERIIEPQWYSKLLEDSKNQTSPSERFTWSAANNTSTTNFQGGRFITASSEVSKWRLVSQGLRINLLNTDEQNGGYWQSCRLNPSYDANGYVLRSTDNNIKMTTGVGGTDQFSFDGKALAFDVGEKVYSDVTGKSIAEHNGYSAAPLKMIGGAMWKLKKYDEGHDFHEIGGGIDFDDDSLGCHFSRYYNPVGAGTVGVRDLNVFSRVGASLTNASLNGAAGDKLEVYPNVGFSSGRRMLDSYLSKEHDMVYIRITANADHAAQLMLSLQSNHEVVYKGGTPLHEHMTAAELRAAELAQITLANQS